jgi:BCD family chlorophyll transporter-like MFS transporter
MGLWGAAQAIAFGLGGLGGAVAVDVGRALLATDNLAFSALFAGQALLFLLAAGLGLGLARPAAGPILREAKA